MKLNRKWLLVIALVMSVVMATGGTLAYLTDRDSEANVFTMGNVDIDLNEVFDPEDAELIPGLDIEKKPTITNTGKTEAWVWATIAIPAALDDADASANVVHFNYSKASVEDGQWNWKNADGNWMIEEDVEIDGVKYNVYTVLYETPLKAGETTTEPVITKVYMDDHIDIDPNGDVYHVEGGVVTDLDWNINTNGQPIIYVSAYAIQTEGFATVQDGYAAYNAQWGDKGTEWGEADNVIDPVPVDTADELATALAAGGEVQLTADIDVGTEKITIDKGTSAVLNLNGHTLSNTSTETGKNQNFFTVKGELTVKGGTLTTEHTGENMGWNNLSAVLSVEGGTLTLEDVTVVNEGGTDMAYGVDVNTTLGTTVLNVEGTTSISSTYTAVRIFNNHKTKTGTVNLNGGTLNGTSRDLWVHNPSANAVDANGVVNINNGATYNVTVQDTFFNSRIYQFD